MSKEDLIKEHIASLQQSEGDHFQVNEQAIIQAYQKEEENKSGIAIKVLAIFGGFLASLAFIGFLFITGVLQSGGALIIFGILLLGTAIGISKTYDKTLHTTASVAMYLIGVLLINLGCADYNTGINIIAFIALGIGLLTLIINQTLIISFVSVIISSIALLVLILSNEAHSLIHLYIVGMTVIFTYIMLFEAQMITSGIKVSKLYVPIRIGVLFAVLFGLIAIGKKGLTDAPLETMWFSAVPLFLIVLYVVHHIVQQLDIKDQKKKTTIYIMSSLILLATIFAPSILGALLIILLCFLVRYTSGVAIGVISLIYFISQYYYDLTFTLLTKSIILFVSGILFLTFYLFIRKKNNDHEKI